MTKKKKAIFGPDVSGPESETKEKAMKADSETLIVPPPEKKAAPIITKPETTAGKLAQPKVTIEIFIRVCGQKPDKMAGFRRWAADQGLKKMPVKEWHQTHQKFLHLPVA